MSSGFEFSIIASKYSEVDKKYHRQGLSVSILTEDDLRESINFYTSKGYNLEHVEITCCSSHDMENVYWEMSAKKWLSIIDTNAGADLNPFKSGYMDLTS